MISLLSTDKTVATLPQKEEKKVTREDLILEGVLVSEIPPCPENPRHPVITGNTSSPFVI